MVAGSAALACWISFTRLSKCTLGTTTGTPAEGLPEVNGGVVAAGGVSAFMRSGVAAPLPCVEVGFDSAPAGVIKSCRRFASTSLAANAVANCLTLPVPVAVSRARRSISWGGGAVGGTGPKAAAAGAPMGFSRDPG